MIKFLMVLASAVDVDNLWVFIWEGDFLGWLQASYVTSLGFVDLVYGLIAMLFFIPLYIRTKSLLLLCIVWILLGGFYIASMQVVSALAILFLALGLGGLLFKVFTSRSR
jgi:hypothetical protein